EVFATSATRLASTRSWSGRIFMAVLETSWFSRQELEQVSSAVAYWNATIVLCFVNTGVQSDELNNDVV
ncbi:MAG: hypothetical protein ABI867_12400, partial [Kofleriaceae bacterium]